MRSWMLVVVQVVVVVAFLRMGSVLPVAALSEESLQAYLTPPPPSYQREDLNIWLVAHSHDDAGWLRTIDEYYIYEVQYILDSVMASLAKNPERKFIEVEIAFFSRWWREQKEEMRDIVRGLVASKQLTFINGGWCMNDEAVPIYYAIIDQLTLGHEFLLHTFGDDAIPTIGWQIDPFGHSNAMANIFGDIGFDAFYMNRIDFRLKEDIMERKEMEFMWEGSSSDGDSIWTHIMDEHYCTPSGFNWEHGVTQDLPDGDGPAPIVFDPPSWATEPNAYERALEFVTEAKRRAERYATNNILIPFGCDFTFQNANMMFKNMDRLIEAINMYSAELGATARYSNLEDYAEFVKSYNNTWVSRKEDFFPYADNSQSYWTGYFSTRPVLKSLSRSAHAVLRGAESLHSLARINHDLDREYLWNEIMMVKAPEAVVQHHDGVTGTMRRIVEDNYYKLLREGILHGDDVIESSLGVFLTNGNSEPALTTNVEDVWDALLNGEAVPVVVYNSLSWRRSEYLVVSVPTPNLAVTDSLGNSLDSQVNDNLLGDDYTLFVKVDVAAMGYTTILIAPAKETTSAPRGVVRRRSVVENEYYRLNFSDATGLLESILNKALGIVSYVNQNFYEYESHTVGQSSGAYIFRPNGAASAVASEADMTVVEGPFVTEIFQTFGADKLASQVTRLFHGLLSTDGGSAIDVKQVIGPLDFNQEISVRYSTDFNSSSDFFTDNNGLEMQHRINLPGGRPGDVDPGVRIAGNFYPAASRAYIRDSSTERQLTLVYQSTHGAASLAEGELELLLHRRCSVDDARGMSENLDDTTVYTNWMKVVLDTHDNSAFLHRRIGTEVQFPLVAAYGSISDFDTWVVPTLEPLNEDVLPSNVHLLSLIPRSADSDELVLRVQHLFEANEHPSYSEPVSLDLLSLFANFDIVAAQERSVTLLHLVDSDPDLRNVVLNPMEIRTFVVTLE